MVAVAVDVGVTVGVTVAVAVTVAVGVGLGGALPIGVGVGVNVAVAVGVNVAVAVAVGVNVAVAVGRRSWRWSRTGDPQGGEDFVLALSANSRSSRTVAEGLVKNVSLFVHRLWPVLPLVQAVDHVKPGLSFVQPQLVVGSAAPREVLRPPFDVEDAVRCSATYRCEDPEPALTRY